MALKVSGKASLHDAFTVLVADGGNEQDYYRAPGKRSKARFNDRHTAPSNDIPIFSAAARAITNFVSLRFRGPTPHPRAHTSRERKVILSYLQICRFSIFYIRRAQHLYNSNMVPSPVSGWYSQSSMALTLFNCTCACASIFLATVPIRRR